jgi:MFS transporter, SET family, sugar efflux transporter
MTSGPGRASGSRLPQLLVSVLLLGIADSMIGPYLVLFGADEARLSLLQVGVFMSVIAVSGLAVSTWLGRRYDRSASRAPAFIALAAPAVGYLALTTTTNYALLLCIAAALLGAGMAAFPQLFTLARTHLDRSGGGSAQRGTPALRSVWSLAWAIGPLIGAAVLAWQGYRGLLVLTALAFALVAVPLLLLGATPAAPPRPATGDAGSRLTRPMLLVGTHTARSTRPRYRRISISKTQAFMTPTPRSRTSAGTSQYSPPPLRARRLAPAAITGSVASCAAPRSPRSARVGRWLAAVP